MTQTLNPEITCIDCGVTAEEIESTIFPRECADCGVKGCACILVEDPHSPSQLYCSDCLPSCYCAECIG